MEMKNKLVYTQTFGNLTENEIHTKLEYYCDGDTTIKEVAEFIGLSPQNTKHYVDAFELPYKEVRHCMTDEEKDALRSEIRKLQGEGLSMKRISDILDIAPSTVYKYSTLK